MEPARRLHGEQSIIALADALDRGDLLAVRRLD